MGAPFARAAAIAAALVKAYAIVNFAERQAALSLVGPYVSRGKGGKRPHHSSHRFVAQDKRDAAKRRNRAR